MKTSVTCEPCKETPTECDTVLMCKCILHCVSDCQTCGWMRATDCSRRQRWFICPSYLQTPLYSWTPTSTGQSVCLFVSVGTLVHNKQKEELLNKVSEPFLSHRMFFWPPPEELHCHFPLIKPRGGSPPFPSVSSSTFLFSLSQRMLGD